MSLNDYKERPLLPPRDAFYGREASNASREYVSPESKTTRRGLVPEIPFSPSDETLQISEIGETIAGKAKVKITNGFIACLDPRSETEVVTYVSVSNLVGTPTPEFEVGAGDIIGVMVETNSKDIVNSAEVTVVNAPSGAPHAVPPIIGQQDGQYFYKLASFKMSDDTPSSIVVDELFHCGGPIYHSFKINEIKNREPVVPTGIAEAFDIYDKWQKSEARHLLRKIWQFVMPEGTGVTVPIIVKEQEEGNSDYEIIAVRLGERETGDPQIRLKSSEDKKLVRIEGNGYDAEKSGTIVKDGLVVQLGEGGGCEDGGNGFIEMIEEGASTGTKVLEWLGGCLKTNIEFQIVVREIMVCEDGVPVARKFLTIEAIPTPTPPTP